MTVIYVIVALVTGFSLFDYYVNRNWEAITSVSRNEAVFAHRNRAYGAYALRSGYNKRMTLILGGLGGTSSVGGAIVKFFSLTLGFLISSLGRFLMIKVTANISAANPTNPPKMRVIRLL